MESTTIPVLVGACLCPGTPHQDGDFVYLRAKLTLAEGTTLQRMVAEANQDRPDAAALTGKLAEAYLLIGIESWDLLDENGKPIPLTPGSIKEQLLDDFTRSGYVADRADDLYMAPVLGPLVRRAAELSSTSTTNGSTSVKPAGRSKPRKRSKPSSITTIPTAAIERTSA